MRPKHVGTISMNSKFKQLTFCACAIVAMSFLLGGCATHYGIKSHRSHRNQDLPYPSQYPTLTLKVGETLRAVTPAKGPLFGGYWACIYIENTEIARHIPRKGDFAKGTNIEAISEGKTKAYYGNSVHMQDENALEIYQEGHWFWIEVIKPIESSK